MKIYVPDYYSAFHCLAGQCPDTCCAAWAVVLDDAAYETYKALDGPLGDRIRAAICEREGEKCFVQKDGRCALLEEDGLCAIQKHLGERALCRVCHFYPRFSTEIGVRRELGLCLSCPEAARLILTNPEPARFLEYEADAGELIPHDVDAELYFQLLAARQTMLQILQNRMRPIAERACLLLDFGEKLQAKLHSHRCRSMGAVSQRYQDTAFLSRRLQKLRRNRKAPYIHLSQAQFYTLRTLEHLSSTWEDQLATASLQLTTILESGDHRALLNEFERQEFERQAEHLMVYFVYKYVLRAAFDRQIAWRLKLAAFSYWIIREMSLVEWLRSDRSFSASAQLELARQYSKELEHSEENMNQMAAVLAQKHYFSTLCTLLLS